MTRNPSYDFVCKSPKARTRTLAHNESGVKMRGGGKNGGLGRYSRSLWVDTAVAQNDKSVAAGPSVCLEGAWELLRDGRGEDAGELFRPGKGQQIAGGRLVYPVFLSVQYPDPPRGNRI